MKGADLATRRRIGVDLMCAALDVIKTSTGKDEIGSFFAWDDLPPKIQYVARFWMGDIVARHAEFINDALASNLSSDAVIARIEAVAGNDAA